MKKAVAIMILFITSLLSAQTIPVTFHYSPQITTFQKCRLVGTFNGWNNADPKMDMSDPDHDGEYKVTIDLPLGVRQMYKFVLDANWGLAWNDPHNPDFNPQDNNNSLITPADPMVVYLLPRSVDTKGVTYIDTTGNGEPIRAVFATTPANPINPASITLTIDGVAVDNPQQYFNTATQELLFAPFPTLADGKHTVIVTANSALGTVTRTTNFRRKAGYVIPKTPVDFYYDQHNTRVLFTQDLSTVSLVGSFNNWNDRLSPMQDNDGDGVWETTVSLPAGLHEYKFKLNYLSWIQDPDWPVFAENGDNSAFAVVTDSMPSIKLVGPNEGKTLKQLPSHLSLQVQLRPGATSKGVNANSIVCRLDGSPVVFAYKTGLLSAEVDLTEQGRHQIDVSFSNLEGVQAAAHFTYGVYTGSTGVYTADAAGDEPYLYPQGVPAGSADILSALIDETADHDSLLFKVEMAAISGRTRLGLLIANPGSKYDTQAPKSLDILTTNWPGNGMFAFLGAPGNAFENDGVENRFMESLDPPAFSPNRIALNAAALANNIFQFTVSVRYLDSLMSSWNHNREFTLFSYLAAEDGSGTAFEATAAEKGSDEEIDPDIYDAAFIRSRFWQNRLLSNYIPAGRTNGPRYVALDGQGRGLISLAAVDISDSLAFFGPQITFLTPEVTYWHPDLTIHGEILGQGVSTAQLFFNGKASTVDVVDSHFSTPVTLIEGKNTAYVVAVDANHIETTSRELALNFTVDHDPMVSIESQVQGRTVNLTAIGSSPDGSNLTYAWSADEHNPAQVALGNGAEISATLPDKEGEYYFNVLATDAQGRTARARELIFARGDTVQAADINDHAAWIDDAIVYEIYPRAFTQQGGFNGVVSRIPDMLDLGINTIWFMPIYEGPTIHGYAITDYYGIEMDYGTEQDFRNMMTTLKAAGIRVILDFVVNHTSIEHPFMLNVLTYHSYSPWKDFYIWEGEPGNSKYAFYFDWDTLPNLNYDTPDVHDYFINVAKYWVQEYGIDGFRCDVAWGVQERNASFWQEWRRALKNIKPELFLEAEASSSDPVFYQQRFDSANDWDLRNSLIGAINGTTTIDELHALAVLSPATPDYARPFRFVENHDEVRMAASHDVQRSILAHSILMTLKGVPLIYSGGEVGELTNRDKINWNGDAGSRDIFKRLIGIHKKYIHNPDVQRLNNDKADRVYSYVSISGSDHVVTMANFKDSESDVTVDFGSLTFMKDRVHYLTNLFTGDVTEIKSEDMTFHVSLAPFEAKLFYLGETPVTAVDDRPEEQTVTRFALYQNYPNPFNPSTTIRFDLLHEEKVTLTVFDLLGRQVLTLLDNKPLSGSQTVTFNASALPSGVYLYRLQAGSFVATKKLVLLK